MDNQVIILLFASVSFISNKFDLPVDLFSTCINLVFVVLMSDFIITLSLILVINLNTVVILPVEIMGKPTRTQEPYPNCNKVK